MISKINSAAILGLDAIPVEIETDIGQGLPNFLIVGLPDKSVEEAKERVRSAIKNSQANYPARRITVNLAPADLRKEGSLYDLPIAISLLVSTNQIEIQEGDIFLGELSLSGDVKKVNGVLPSVLMAKNKGYRRVFIPEENIKEASVIDGIDIYPIANLEQLISFLKNETQIKKAPLVDISDFFEKDLLKKEVDMFYIAGQEHVKRAMEIAAAGGHNLFMTGPPGTGKTYLAKAFSSILPKLSFDEMLEISKIYSISGFLSSKKPLVCERPFRNPHHTASNIALVGGGQWPKPGEISLAHRGVLFLDELPEFKSDVLEVLRQPLEEKFITISRAQGSLTYPSNFILIAASNPCPCGFLGDDKKECVCSTSQIIRYSKKISGPLLDRIDIYVRVPRVEFDKLNKNDNQENSKEIRKRVEEAREIQKQRFSNLSILTNSEMGPEEVKRFCKTDHGTMKILKEAVDNIGLSARGYHKVLKMARTIADIEKRENISKNNVAEALQYRQI